MSTVEIRNIHAPVDAADLWRAETLVGRARVRRAIAAAVGAAVHEIAEPHRSFADRVAEKHAAGLCDALIADELKALKYRVADARRALGLKPNRCHRSGRRK